MHKLASSFVTENVTAVSGCAECVVCVVCGVCPVSAPRFESLATANRRGRRPSPLYDLYGHTPTHCTAAHTARLSPRHIQAQLGLKQ